VDKKFFRSVRPNVYRNWGGVIQGRKIYLPDLFSYLKGMFRGENKTDIL